MSRGPRPGSCRCMTRRCATACHKSSSRRFDGHHRRRWSDGHRLSVNHCGGRIAKSNAADSLGAPGTSRSLEQSEASAGIPTGGVPWVDARVRGVGKYSPGLRPTRDASPEIAPSWRSDSDPNRTHFPKDDCSWIDLAVGLLQPVPAGNVTVNHCCPVEDTTETATWSTDLVVSSSIRPRRFVERVQAAAPVASCGGTGHRPCTVASACIPRKRYCSRPTPSTARVRPLPEYRRRRGRNVEPIDWRGSVTDSEVFLI